MQASKNYELFCKRKINLQQYSYILCAYWFIYPDMLGSLRGFLMKSLLFFFEPIPPLVNKSSKSRYLEFSPGVISLSRSRAILKAVLSRTFCPVPLGFEIAALDCTNYKKCDRFDQLFKNDLCKKLEAKNDFCCIKFRSNRCKKENSCKQNIPPLWRGAVECTFKRFSCKINLKILKRKSNNKCVTFEGKIKHNSLEIKHCKTTGENREHYRVLLKDNETFSKLHRLGLLKLSGDQFTSGRRTGPSRSALNNIKAHSSLHESA